jgi:hypothetical protein
MCVPVLEALRHILRRWLRLLREARLPASVKTALNASREPQGCAAPTDWPQQQRSPRERHHRSLGARLGLPCGGVSNATTWWVALFLLLLFCRFDISFCLSDEEGWSDDESSPAAAIAGASALAGM